MNQIIFGLFLLIVTFSFLLYYFEPGMENFNDALWYCFAIVTTIGFGDLTAVTDFGRILSVILGIYGIVLSTVISYFLISIPWIIKNVFGLIFTDESMGAFAADLVRWALLIAAAAVINYQVCNLVPLQGIGEIAAKLVISIIIPNALFILLFHKKQEFKTLRVLAGRMVRRRI